MSYSTLDDFYRGMKMPTYDGKNMFSQMRNLQSLATQTAQQHESWNPNAYETEKKVTVVREPAGEGAAEKANEQSFGAYK